MNGHQQHISAQFSCLSLINTPTMILTYDELIIKDNINCNNRGSPIFKKKKVPLPLADTSSDCSGPWQVFVLTGFGNEETIFGLLQKIKI